METTPKSRKGFASMDPEKRRLIAQAGGRKAHAVGTAHKWTSEQAKLAGKKGAAIRTARRALLKTGLVEVLS
jgi:general stress protein YciG